jgi:hypothetical protein
MACYPGRAAGHGRSFGEPGVVAEVPAEQIVALQAPRITRSVRPLTTAYTAT